MEFTIEEQTHNVMTCLARRRDPIVVGNAPMMPEVLPILSIGVTVERRNSGVPKTKIITSTMPCTQDLVLASRRIPPRGPRATAML
jgi:hypothetical protein